MTAYIVFFIGYNNGMDAFFAQKQNVTFGKTIAYKQKKNYLVLVCIEMI